MAKMSDEKGEVQSVLTPKFWAVTIVSIVVVSIVSLFTGLFTAWTPWYNALGNGFGGTVPHTTFGPNGPILVMVILWILSTIGLKKNMKPQQMGVLFAAVLVAFLQAGYPKWVLFDAATGPMYAYPAYAKYVPALWSAPQDVFAQALAGGPVPWGSWAVPITYWIIWSIVFFAFGFSWASIGRRRWIDVAMLPFPYAQVASTPILQATAAKDSEAAKGPRTKLVILGAIICFLFYTPIILRKIWPWFPDIYGFESFPFIPWHMGSFDTTTASPALSSVFLGYMQWNFNFFWYGFFYIVSSDVTFTVLVVWLVVDVLTPHILAVTGGLPSPWPVGSRSRAGWLMTQPPVNYVSLAIGMFFAVLAFELIVHRKYYAETLRFKAPTPEEAKKEAVPYRIAWIMFFATIIILTGMLVASGATVVGGLFAILGIFVYMVAFNTMYSEAAMEGILSQQSTGIFWWALYRDQMTVSADQYPAHLIFAQGTNDALFAGTAGYVSAAFKVASITGTSNKDVFKSMMVSVVVANIIALPLIVWSIYTFGHTRIPVRGGGNYAVSFIAPATAKTWPKLDLTWPWTIVGFAILGVTTFLRATYAWFPLNPVGMLLMAATTVHSLGVEMPAIIAWILKQLTLRIGGTKVYEKYGMPIAIGMIIGFTFYSLVYSSIAIYRQFIPY